MTAHKISSGGKKKAAGSGRKTGKNFLIAACLTGEKAAGRRRPPLPPGAGTAKADALAVRAAGPQGGSPDGAAAPLRSAQYPRPAAGGESSRGREQQGERSGRGVRSGRGGAGRLTEERAPAVQAPQARQAVRCPQGERRISAQRSAPWREPPWGAPLGGSASWGAPLEGAPLGGRPLGGRPLPGGKRRRARGGEGSPRTGTRGCVRQGDARAARQERSVTPYLFLRVSSAWSSSSAARASVRVASRSRSTSA